MFGAVGIGINQQLYPQFSRPVDVGVLKLQEAGDILKLSYTCLAEAKFGQVQAT